MKKIKLKKSNFKKSNNFIKTNKLSKPSNFASSGKLSKIVVQKYGGATLDSPQKILEVARRISSLHKTGVQIVACVSAMGKSTNQLIALAGEISQTPNRRELDMLLTTGERISMSLVSMALNDLKCAAISFTGSQAGILTNDSHVNAVILDVKATRVRQALKNNQVVVLAGFQGVSPQTKDITTLGRGGTDTTAVAMSAFLKADCCEILKDVSGVYTADPKIVAHAKPIQKLSYEQMLDMTFWGAKVLHYRSVELAKQKNVKIYIGPANKKNSIGTVITNKKELPMFENSKVLSVNSHEQVLELKIKTANALKKFKTNLEDNEIPFPQILLTRVEGDTTFLYITGASEVLFAIINNKMKNYTLLSKNLSSVTATCTGIASDIIHESIFSSLERAKINPLFSISSAMSLSILVASTQRTKTIQALHRLVQKS